MRNARLAAMAVFGLLMAALASGADLQESRLVPQDLPPLPEPMAAHFLGAHDGALIAAGGASVRDGGPANTDRIYALGPNDAQWRDAGQLPALISGASASTPGGIVAIADDAAGAAEIPVYLLRWDGQGVRVSSLPGLPRALPMSGAGVLKNTVYVAGGWTPGAAAPGNDFLALELDAPGGGWRALDPIPGGGRMQPLVAGQDESVYVIGGGGGPGGGDASTTGYRYHPRSGWKPIAALPEPMANPVGVPVGPSHLYVISTPTSPETGASTTGAHVWAYHTITDTWTRAGDLPPFGPGARAAFWQGQVVVAGGVDDATGFPAAATFAARPTSVSRDIFPLDYAVMAVYFVLMVGMGWYFSRREKTTADFFVGGKRVPWWAAGISIFGTVLSAITFLSIPAMAFRTDWVYLPGNLIVVLIAVIVVFYYLPFFRRLDVTSAYEYLERRFNLVARLFGSVLFLVFQLGRLGIVLYLPSLALSAATGLDITTAIVLMGLLTIFYTVLGGIEAVIWTDVVQVIVLLGGAILALGVMIAGTDGGVADFVGTAWRDGKFRMFDWGWDATAAVAWVVLVGRAFENLVPHTTDQSVIQRYLTTPTERQAANAIWLGNLMAVPSSILFFSLGTALYVFYREHPHRLDPTLQTDATFPLFIVEQLPMGVTGLIIAALFAASMSTLDSGMNSIATVVVTDFYRRFKREVSESRALALARWITVFVGLLGTGSALILVAIESRSLWEQYMKIVGLFGSSLAGLFALGIFTRRATGAGALVGAAASVVTLALVQHYGPVSFLLYSAIGIVTCFVVGYAASFLLGRNGDLTGLTWSRLNR